VNLFAKIFAGFWLSSIAIIGSWLLAAQYFDPAPTAADPIAAQPHAKERAGRHQAQAGPGAPRHIYRLFYGLQTVNAGDLPAWIEKQETRDKLRIFLVDQKGAEIFDKKLVPGVDRVLEKLAGFRRRASHREGRVMLFGQEFYRPEWGSINLIIAQYPPASPFIRYLTDHLWLRLLLALVISGAISYAVSRYLTRPLKNLQQASRSLAGGNLDTRIAVSAKGGDETDELARDFNSMAQQLQEKIQTQKRLLNDVSHELRSPLARLRVALALAEEDPSRVVELLKRIDHETERLDELIGQLLAVPDAAIELEDSLDLVALLRELCSDAGFESQQHDKQIQFSSDLAEAIVSSHSDLLKKAFENVIRNAVQYSPAGSVVDVSITNKADSCLITIDDSGPGIPEPDLQRVFEPFYRVDTARQRETGGFGLGLSIARRAIDQHGGTIAATNKDPGLRVTIQLPA
jgi:two-component system sensor histidine kinase CpxA